MIKIKYDGVTINDQILGFKVKSVSGRELLGAEIEEREMPVLAGSQFIRRRYPTRDIIVNFQIQAPTKEAYRIRFNKLNALLNKEEVEIVFSDEVDKYFIASTSEMDANEITFHCTDPFKYSTVVKSFPAALEDGILTAKIINNGTVSVPIDYRIHMNHENGFVGIVSEHGAMQYGKKEEADGKTVQQSERLLNMSNFFSAPDDGASGIDYMHPTYDATGTLSVSTWWGEQWLSFGSAGPNPGGAMTGGQRTVAVPADSSGHRGAKNFYAYFFVVMWAGAMGQVGEFNINFLTADNKQIAGLNWYKQDLNGNTAHYELWANGQIVADYAFESSHETSQNPFWRTNGHCDLQKSGRKLRYYVPYWGGYKTVEVPEIENWECAKVSMAFKCHPQYRNRLVTHMGVKDFFFNKDNVSKWMDIPNRYAANQDMIIKGTEGKMYFQGMPRPADEITGTKYFKAGPGVTKVEFYHSSFSTPAPTITAEIREAWL